ncbi:hypothetical protein GCM10010327_42040 [Streptomyces nitrosporeus]|nr:hypothetical protein GCM10010327_42040 [Streptomyces nitrosporeus]
MQVAFASKPHSARDMSAAAPDAGAPAGLAPATEALNHPTVPSRMPASQVCSPVDRSRSLFGGHEGSSRTSGWWEQRKPPAKGVTAS